MYILTQGKFILLNSVIWMLINMSSVPVLLGAAVHDPSEGLPIFSCLNTTSINDTLSRICEVNITNIHILLTMLKINLRLKLITYFAKFTKRPNDFL